MQTFEWFLAWRYLRGKRAGGVQGEGLQEGLRGGFLSFVSWVALLGIALGVWALIVVVSVMNGFVREIRDNLLGVVSHAVVRPLDGVSTDEAQWQNLIDTLKRDKGIVAMAPFIEQQGLISESGRVQPVVVRGISPELEPSVAPFLNNPLSGDVRFIQAGEFQAMIGKHLALNMGLRLGDRFTLIAPQGNFTPAGMIPRLRRFTVVGVFESGLYEYDSGLMLAHRNDTAQLFQMSTPIGALRLRFDDVLRAPIAVRQLNQSLPNNFYASDWGQSHANFFRAVEIEKRMMFLILTIIIAVAAFNVVNQQVLLIGEKAGDIAILRTLGASSPSVVRLFMLQGIFLGGVGIVMGLLAGCVTAINVTEIVHTIENLFNVRFLSPEVYQIPDIPSELKWGDVALTAVVALTITVLATLYPSYRAARILPAQALRYQ